MGQSLFKTLETSESLETSNTKDPHHDQVQLHDTNPCSSSSSFPDLASLPAELSLIILANLNATDLSLAACVWQQLATDEMLWQSLCQESWGHVEMYSGDGRPRFRSLFLQLDEGTLAFNAEPHRGMDYFFERNLVRDDDRAVALFFHHTKKLSKEQMGSYLRSRPGVMEQLVSLQNFSSLSLPNALRKCFAKLQAPEDRDDYLHRLMVSFSKQFCSCNPRLGYSEDAVYVLCFSLILLSVDLWSPHVRNKMSKREFIRNTRNALSNLVNDELIGEMYDNVFIRGHVSHDTDNINKGNSNNNSSYYGFNHGYDSHHVSNRLRFVPGYLALFL